MRPCTLRNVLFATAVALLGTPLAAHGGVYRGPGDVVPPTPGGPPHPRGSGPSPGRPTGRPVGPSQPIPVPPPTGGVPRPSCGGNPPRPGSSGRRGSPLADDLTDWTFWWEFNKHGFLGLRRAVHGGGPITGCDDPWMGPGLRHGQRDHLEPTRGQIRNDVLPALKRALDTTEQRDIVSSCMIAMARIGVDHPDFRLHDVFARRLTRDNQEVRETAALALGIAGIDTTETVDLLADLALDAARARKIHGRHVNARTRAFALYGLGLLAHGSNDLAIKERAFATMATVLNDDRVRDRNLKVAAIVGTGLLAFDRDDAAAAPRLDAAVHALLHYYERDLGAGERLIQAHCPTAIVKLIGREHARSDEFRQRFAAELAGENRRRRSHDLARSCALALGQLCEPFEDRFSRDAGYSELLMSAFEEHKDAQTRYFALLALGQIGGTRNRKFLLRVLHTGHKALERPWAALALGVDAWQRHVDCEAHGQDCAPDRLLGDALLTELKQARHPKLVGALGIALGLAGHRDAAPTMQFRLQREPQKQEQAGYLSLGLALMNERRAVGTIQTVMDAATRRTRLFVQAAIALGVLGDKSAADRLHERLRDQGQNLATLAAVAGALGKIGDRRSIAPLQRILADSARGDLARAFAAVALGAVADRAEFPWHAAISANINYRAAVETLTNGHSGVLDIL